ncbi:alpha/beta fold hydrolase [Pseudoalteromonas luteoviolacea]|uniref:alpha/beta fold hydrolase n=1 Tax=Pseudoalteromonas luteoviolacea TaxID=43657 RepID=UPI001F449C16|nr:alpha/beta fold hydrolase [Pseudoalteromonas luteoviolacea]MCF6440699.1 alpha/beta fold hydrolase [Pseudoalteromonas luteoviolacea]
MLLNFKQSGLEQSSAKTVILIHGLFGSLENLNIIARALEPQFNVVNVDLRNHGRSFKSDDMNYQVMAQDILSLIDHLKLEQVILVGHSMGGKVAMQVAMLDEQKVSKLVVLDIAPVQYHPRHDAIIAALNKVTSRTPKSRSDADKIMSDNIEELGVRQFLLKSLAKNEDGELEWRFNLPIIEKNYSKIIDNIDTPRTCLCDTLFVKGNNSDYILPEHKNDIVSAFSKARAKIIQGAGHWLHAEKPEAVNRSIIDFIQ